MTLENCDGDAGDDNGHYHNDANDDYDDYDDEDDDDNDEWSLPNVCYTSDLRHIHTAIY
ncbi:hypothetical protein DPMN_141073 [Dreissena polymorpha]|uniref:Uncharacterized protein n=1 Tax=Dreissena polymorpha TaxID=45954 RepID=A0A9D4G9A1_DREPO|nr:hypothetical protein DPMN_141073 [Dreissena polymorpha]